MSAFLLDSTEDIEAAVRGESDDDDMNLDLVERAPRPRKEKES